MHSLLKPRTQALSLAVASTITGLAVAAPQTAAYDELTDTYRSYTNLNVETTRGMALASDDSLVVINTHGSTLNVHTTDSSLLPDSEWATVNNPIALGLYQGQTEQYAVVLGGSTHSVVLQSLATGRILFSAELGAETGDLVVDNENNRAFVSLPGNNTIVQLSLPRLFEQGRVEVPSQRPRFLYLDDQGDGIPGNNTVLVTPELSGNNTTFFEYGTRFQAIKLETVPASGGNPEIPVTELPDEDLFRITPQASGPPTIAAVLRDVGTILTAHGRNPANGDYWMLGTDSLNAIGIGEFLNPAGPNLLTEPILNGKFAMNEVTIAATLGSGSGTTPDAPASLDLDTPDGSGGYVEADSISFPYALEFHPLGFGVIAGSASDQLRFLQPNGNRLGDLELTPGSIPRDLAFGPDNRLYVYCWGTNKIQVFDGFSLYVAMSGSPGIVLPVGTDHLRTLEVGADPLSDRAKRGRETFYDADNSLDGRVTCNHCHPGAGMDLLGWNIRDFPHDAKDLMVTQSLKAIEDTFPYHWRGERDLEAFNGAFAGILGGEILGEELDGDFADFKAFIFSLQVHANPIQNPLRILDASYDQEQTSTNPQGDGMGGVLVGLGNPVQGQIDMDLPEVLFDSFSCADCHAKVSGTVGDINGDDVGFVPSSTNMDVAHFRQLFHKIQATAQAGVTGSERTIALGGFGLSHDGDSSSAFDFLNRTGFDLDAAPSGQLQSEKDLGAFILQADQGISPAAHRMIHVTAGVDLVDLAGFIAQANVDPLLPDHWIDVAAIGSHTDSNGVKHELTWFATRVAGDLVFFSDDSGVVFPNLKVGYQTWTELRDAAIATPDEADFYLIGLPPGNSVRFAVDRDNDELFDSIEAFAGTSPYNADSDGDDEPDGHEFANGGTQADANTQSNDTTAPSLIYARVDHVAASYIKTVLRFSEPVSIKITGTNSAVSPAHQVIERRFVPRRFDSVTIQRLLPSLPDQDYTNAPAGYPFAEPMGTDYMYSFTVEMTDLSGNTSSITFPSVQPTKDQLARVPIPFTWTAGDPIPPAQLARIVTDLDWAPSSPSGSAYQANVSTEIRYEDPEIEAGYNPVNPLDPTPNGNSNPRENQTVVAQILHFDSSTGVWGVLPKDQAGVLSVTATSNPDSVQDTVGFLRDGIDPMTGNPFTASDIEIEGPFVLSTLTDSNGDASIDFSLTQTLPANDKIKVNIIAIVEQDARDVNPGVNEFWGPSIRSYQMPATAPEQRGIQYP